MPIPIMVGYDTPASGNSPPLAVVVGVSCEEVVEVGVGVDVIVGVNVVVTCAPVGVAVGTAGSVGCGTAAPETV